MLAAKRMVSARSWWCVSTTSPWKFHHGYNWKLKSVVSPVVTTASAKARYSSQNVETGKPNDRKKVTVLDIRRMHKEKKPISMLTAYDFPTAMFVENAGIDMLLVGDSLAMVALGYMSTASITMEEMLHHCKAVQRGAKSPFLVADLPFGSYEVSKELALQNSVRFIKEASMESVKLEGGIEMAETIRFIVSAGIPVLGHIGLTPQSQSALGGYRVQGKTAERAYALLQDSLALQDAGCYGIVLEAIPAEVAKVITDRLSIPTIGIGAGPHCSGQVLVQNDMLGVFNRFVPRFCKQYLKLAPMIEQSLASYHEEVKNVQFPAKEHCYPMPQEEYEKFLNLVKKNL